MSDKEIRVLVTGLGEDLDVARRRVVAAFETAEGMTLSTTETMADMGMDAREAVILFVIAFGANVTAPVALDVIKEVLAPNNPTVRIDLDGQ